MGKVLRTDALVHNKLYGVYQKTITNEGDFVLQYLPKKDGLAFYHVATGQEPTIYQFHAFLYEPDLKFAKSVFLMFDDGTTTEVKPIDWSDEANEPKQIYGVNGVRQQGLKKGINIVRMTNGNVKKILKK